MVEWRSYLKVNQGLQEIARPPIYYNQGLMLCYRNTAYSGMRVGKHPRYGQLGVVDAAQFAFLDHGMSGVKGNDPGGPARVSFSSFLNLKDAAFSLDRVPDANLSIYPWAVVKNIKGEKGVPLFDDSLSYFDGKNPYGGLMLPNYGLKIKVTGNAPDYSQGLAHFEVTP